MTASASHDTAPRALMMLIAAAIVLFFVLVDPIPQDPAYHSFVDGRRLLSVPNFWNVMSNLPFVIVGAWGLTVAARYGKPALKVSYIIVFIGVFLTAFGSGYYHLEPGNDTLFWDRLPMTIAFAGLFAAVIGEYYALATTTRLALIFLIIGVASVVYWQWSEGRGAGDLRPYAVVQFLPMLAVPLILLKRGMYSPLTPYIWTMIGFYLLAKVFEFFDGGFYVAELISGHSLKHLLAACGPAALAFGLAKHSPPQPSE